jgi:diguanylate cyclase (GGDEF)-like protein
MPSKTGTKKTAAGKKAVAKTQAPVRDFKSLFYRKLTENHLFYEVGKIIASETEPSELITRVMAVIKKEIHFEDVTVYVVKPDLTGILPIHASGPLFLNKKPELAYLDTGAPDMIASSGEPLFLKTTAQFEGYLQFSDEVPRPGSYLGIALQNEKRIIGVMGFSHSGAEAFRVEEFDTLRTLAPLISAGFEKAELFKKTLELSRVDELTGLFNYRVLTEKLEEEIRRKVRTGREFSFIMVDIDDFKRVNDRYGHLEGSRVIAQLGALLKLMLRTDSTDTCYRYGGEEFSVLLAETSFEDAGMVAERIRKAVEDYPFSLKVAHPHEPLTISLGVSSMRGEHPKQIHQLIEEADVALYNAKAAGKNRVVCFSEGCRMPVKPDAGRR